MDGYGLLGEYLDVLKAVGSRSPNTLEAYGNDIRQFLAFLADKQIDIAAVADGDAILYLGLLEGQHLSKRSIARKISCLRGFFTYCRKHGYTEHNPFSSVSTRGTGRPLPTVLTVEEVHRLLSQPTDTFPKLRNVLLFTMLYDTGCRIGELLPLNVRDVDLEADGFLVMGKGSKQRKVYLTDHCRELARYYLSQRSVLQRLKGIKGKSDLDIFFVSDKGKRLSISTVESIFEAQRLAFGWQKRFTPHVLRHTYATHLLDNGASIRVVQELLGHVSLSTTQIYTHVSQKKMREVYLDSHPHGRET
ncbi:MAG: tyrosine-type recombinase/integrase [Spirochaetia bacterium]|jgi:site-specific recombinase XerD|nr:tyrosine-type recombinase/integrase [Spirochaetia bacterium]